MQVFKIVQAEEWDAARAAGVYHGSTDDQRDGFIHLSTSAQLAGTLARHFANATGLMLVALESDALGAKLRWERNAAGEVFSHLYHSLDFSWVRWTAPIHNKAPGVFALPAQAFATEETPPGAAN